MSTHSQIGIVRQDGAVVAIYCHWDGYPSHNGRLLLAHYTTAWKVETLMSLGDVSALRENIDPPDGVEHSFESPDETTCIAYGRDRGETGTEARTFLDIELALQCLRDGYLYLFDAQAESWSFRSFRYADELRPLTERDCK